MAVTKIRKRRGLLENRTYGIVITKITQIP